MSIINHQYALGYIRDLIMQLMRVWQIVMLMEECAWCEDWDAKTTKAGSAKYLLKCLRYMKLDDNFDEDREEFRYI